MNFFFYPNSLYSGSLLAYVIKNAGYGVVSTPSKADVIVHWDNRNVSSVNPALYIYQKPIINRACWNIKKDYVDQVFTDAFGYSSLVNPIIYDGMMVVKSTQNAIHNGKLIQGPLINPDLKFTEKDGVYHHRIYQRFIDNMLTTDEAGELQCPYYNKIQYLIEYRVTMCFGEIVGCLERIKPDTSRFHIHDTDKVQTNVINPRTVFTGDELRCLKIFADKFVIDFADLDILRDRMDGRIYVVDVNNMSIGTMYQAANNKKHYLDGITKIFKEQIKRRCNHKE